MKKYFLLLGLIAILATGCGNTNNITNSKGCIGEKGPAGCLLYLEQNYSTVDCSNPASKGYKYCGPTISGYNDDRWAGAKYACSQKGMHLPTENELKLIYLKKASYKILNNNKRWFWTATENPNKPKISAMTVFFTSGRSSDGLDKRNPHHVLCVGN